MIKKIILSAIVLLSVLSILITFASNPIGAIFQDSMKHAPSDTVAESQIKVYGDKVVLEVEGATWVSYENSGSMKPILDEWSNGLEIIIESEDEINVGDIVSYNADWNDTLVVHRVIEIGEDERGRYFILKGDNNQTADPGKIRFSQIKYKTIAIIY
ncbi:MAG: signal peptidase I [Nanoarchaeota archaeon]|nr:signal peptidase I [Nanoarchaeota archaeon]